MRTLAYKRGRERCLFTSGYFRSPIWNRKLFGSVVQLRLDFWTARRFCIREAHSWRIGE